MKIIPLSATLLWLSAILGMVAHRSSKMMKEDFNILIIKLPDAKKYYHKKHISKKLPSHWKYFKKYSTLQDSGREWYQSKDRMILKIPSDIVDGEYYYLLNTVHPDFGSTVSVRAVKDFFLGLKVAF